MKFQTATIIATLLAATSAAPATQDTSPINPLMHNYCRHSSFNDQTSAGSAPVSDCLNLAKSIQNRGVPSWYEYTAHDVNKHVSYGNCTFDVKSPTEAAMVGNQDVIDLIHLSIDKFASNGKVSSKGKVPCAKVQTNIAGPPMAHSGTTPVYWSIY